MKHYLQSHNDAMHQLTKQDNRLLWHRHGLCYLRFFLISLLVVFLMSPVSAQDFKLFYANNVTDVTDFDKITEPNSGLDWRQVTDTDMDGNMTDEQKMLCQVHSSDVAYNLYWGQQLFHAERYYEAILHLENVYHSYREVFFDLTAEQKRTFMEVAYKLGFCYNELGQPKLAFYYLDLMASDGNIRHTMELVNSMANSKDLRLFSYTEDVMDEVKLHRLQPARPG